MLKNSGVSAFRSSFVRISASRLYKPCSSRALSASRTIEKLDDKNSKKQSDDDIAHVDHLKMGGRLAAEAFRQEELLDDEEYSFEDEKVELAEEISLESKFARDGEQAQALGSSGKVEVEQEEVAEGDVPWYLRAEESSKLESPIFKTELPEIPEGSPASVEPILKFASEELGLEDFKIFDITGREDIPASSYVDYMIVSTGKSEKHIQNAVDELAAFLKNKFKTVPYVEGLLKANSMKRQKKRMKRKARKGDFVDLEYGVGPNSWVMVDTRLDGICFHVLTTQRRESTNLELLWCKPEEKAMYAPRATNSTVSDHVDSIFHGLQRRFYSTGRTEVSGVELAIQQFQIGDLKSFADTRLENSLDFLRHIIDDLNAKSFANAQEELASPDNKTVEFFNNAFPIMPTREHFQLRYEFFSILNKILPEVYPLETLTTILIEQSSAGDFITEAQFNEYVEDLIVAKTATYQEQLLRDSDMNELFRWKFANLTKILKIMDLQNTRAIDSEFITKLLLLSSQRITSNKKAVPVSKHFKILLDLFKDKELDNSTIYIVLSNMGKAQDVKYFSKFWEHRLPTYVSGSNSFELDARPWFVLVQVLHELQSGKLNDWFLTSQLQVLIDSKVVITSEMKKQIFQIMDSHDAGYMKRLLE